MPLSPKTQAVIHEFSQKIADLPTREIERMLRAAMTEDTAICVSTLSPENWPDDMDDDLRDSILDRVLFDGIGREWTKAERRIARKKLGG